MMGDDSSFQIPFDVME